MAAYFIMSVIVLNLVVPGLSVTEEHAKDLENVLGALNKMMNFYKESYRNLNLDGFFGLRIIQGQLQVLLSEYKSSAQRNISLQTLDHLQSLVQSASDISSLGLKYIENDDPVYFGKFRRLILSPWKIWKPHRKLEPHLRWEIPQYKAKLKVKLTEDLSDKCLSQLLHPDCNISDDCAAIMTTRGLTGYGITHQILWSAVGEAMPNCSNKINKIIETGGAGNVTVMQLEWCTNNFYEMVAIVQVLMHRKIQESQQDLFFEQQFVCPSLGFYEFLKMDYLRQMLLWQFPSGCFGDRETETDHRKVDIDSLLQNYQEGQTHFLHKSASHNLVNNFHIENSASRNHKSNTLNLTKDNNMKGKKSVSANEAKLTLTSRVSLKNNSRYLEVNKSQEATKYYKLTNGIKAERHLLNEKQMNDGCLSHKTAVAAGALCIYLRYLIEPSNIQWNGQHELFLMDMRSLLQSDREGQIKLSDLENENNNNQGEVAEAAGDNAADYPAEEEDEEEGEEEGDEEEGYNEGGADYVTDQPVKVVNKVRPANPGVQFDHRDNDNIIVNNDNEQELMEYSDVREDTNAQQHMALPIQGDNAADDTREQQEDHNYYDDEGETEKGIIKRTRLITPRPHPPIRTRKKHGGSDSVSNAQSLYSDQPNYVVIVLVSMTPFFVLFFFLLKFVRKRRVYTRHHF